MAWLMLTLNSASADLIKKQSIVVSGKIVGTVIKDVAAILVILKPDCH